MHTIIHPSQWKDRAEALGLTLNELARQAGVSHPLLYRKLKEFGLEPDESAESDIRKAV